MASEVPSSLRHCVSHYNSVVSPTLVPWAPMEIILRNSLAVRWLGLYAFTAGATGLIPSQRTKIPSTVWCGKKTKTTTKKSSWHIVDA